MCVGITAKQIMLERAPDFGDPVSSYRGRELFEATPISRPVTSYRAIRCFHVTTLEGPRKARSVAPDCGEETHKEGRHRGRGCGSQSLKYIFSVVWERILYIDAMRSIPEPFFLWPKFGGMIMGREQKSGGFGGACLCGELFFLHSEGEDQPKIFWTPRGSRVGCHVIPSRVAP